MNIIISEQQFRLLTEALARKNVLSDTVFVSYGTDKLDLNNVKPVETGNNPLHYRIAVSRNKPYGGLWASPLTSTRGWGEWCSDNDFRLDTLSHHFLFKLSPDANIYVIDTMDDLSSISTMKDEYGRRFMDFQRLSRDYDGIFVTADAVSSLRMHDDMYLSDLYSWDVESLCVWNADVIVPVEENAFERAGVENYAGRHGYDYDFDGYSYADKKERLQLQQDSDYERYSNRNVDGDMSKYFNGEHPAILAQGHGNGKKAKLARRFDGTIKSGM